MPGDAPSDLHADVVELGDVELLVVSYPASALDLRADTPLTRAEAEVAALAIEGRSNAEIARARGKSERTIANQMASVLRKLGVASRHELAVRFVRDELPEVS